MKLILKTATLFLVPFLLGAQHQDPRLISLYRSLSNATSDTARMTLYRDLGSYYIGVNRDSSEIYFGKSLSMAIRLHLRFDEASILNVMGAGLMQQEKFSKSLEFYLKALNIAKDPAIEKTIWELPPGHSPASARMLMLSRCYDLIGLLNAYTGNWIVNTKNQLKNYREAAKYAAAAGDRGQIAYVNFHMGIAYMSEGKLDSALLLINHAIATFTVLNDQYGLGRAMKYLGDTYKKMEQYDLAANTILQAIPVLKESNDQLHLGLAYLSLSRVYTDLKKNDSALHYAKESLYLFEKRKDRGWKRDAYNLVSSCFDRLGRTDSAIVYLRLTKSLSDSLSVEERTNLLAFQDVFVEEQIKLEKLEKEKMQTRERSRVYALMAGIVVITLIVLLLYRNNRVRKRTNEMLKQRNKTIENTLHQLRSTQSQLIQSEKMASLGELTAGIAHEIQNPLNFVNNFSEVNSELIDELRKELTIDNKQLAIKLAEDIKENEAKIVHHGKRADAIVKSMLQHSRKSSGQKEFTDINELCDEYLRLAYHGLRAKDKSFNAKFETHFDPNLPKINVVPQEIGRVVLNLINNAFYAVTEKNRQNPENCEPVVIVSTSLSPGEGRLPAGALAKAGGEARVVEITVSDNGSGIQDHIKDKIFQPFFTTKPTGQGTGLGLSLSYDIITKGHGGEIKVETKEGEGTMFVVHLPIV